MIGGSLLEDFLRYFGDHGWLVYRIEDAGLNLVRQNGIDNDLGISGNFLASKIQLLNNWTSLVQARAEHQTALKAVKVERDVALRLMECPICMEEMERVVRLACASDCGQVACADCSATLENCVMCDGPILSRQSTHLG